MYRQSEKNLLNSNTSSTCPDNMVNFGLLTAEICWRVWGTPATFNGFRVLAALLHSTLVVRVSDTLRRWTEGATYIRQGGHHVGHWPTFWSNSVLKLLQIIIVIIIIIYNLHSVEDISNRRYGLQWIHCSTKSTVIYRIRAFCDDEIFTFPNRRCGRWTKLCCTG